jgi:hypothetical protein
MRTGLSSEGASDCELHGQDGVCVAVRDAITAAVEGAYVVCGCAGLSRACACKLGLCGSGHCLLWLSYVSKL